MSEVQVGDYIQSVDPITLETTFSEVFLFLDYNPNERRTFLRLHLRSGRVLTVTPTHLIMTRDVRDSGAVRTMYADRLSVGDVLFTSSQNASTQQLIADELIRIEAVLRTGVYAPLTKAGTVVVDGVAASCYATIDSARLAHAVFAPLRLLTNLREGVVRLYHIVRSPLRGWHAPTKTKEDITKVLSNDIDNHIVANTNPTPIGVHWYARTLYIFGDVLIPSHMRS